MGRRALLQGIFPTQESNPGSGSTGRKTAIADELLGDTDLLVLRPHNECQVSALMGVN